jgi:hypothetical protein
METSLHSHIIGIHVQERIAFAERERVAREARGPRGSFMSRLHLPRRTAPTPVRRVGAGPA